MKQEKKLKQTILCGDNRASSGDITGTLQLSSVSIASQLCIQYLFSSMRDNAKSHSQWAV